MEILKTIYHETIKENPARGATVKHRRHRNVLRQSRSLFNSVRRRADYSPDSRKDMCEQCLGQGCPNCWPEVKECERCSGSGWVYFVIDPDTGEEHECTAQDFDNACEEYRREEICPDCDGRGEWEEK